MMCPRTLLGNDIAVIICNNAILRMTRKLTFTWDPGLQSFKRKSGGGRISWSYNFKKWRNWLLELLGLGLWKCQLLLDITFSLPPATGCGWPIIHGRQLPADKADWVPDSPQRMVPLLPACVCPSLGVEGCVMNASTAIGRWWEILKETDAVKNTKRYLQICLLRHI